MQRVFDNFNVNNLDEYYDFMIFVSYLIFFKILETISTKKKRISIP